MDGGSPGGTEPAQQESTESGRRSSGRAKVSLVDLIGPGVHPLSGQVPFEKLRLELQEILTQTVGCVQMRDQTVGLSCSRPQFSQHCDTKRKRKNPLVTHVINHRQLRRPLIKQ